MRYLCASISFLLLLSAAPAFAEAPLSVDGAKTISLKEARKLFKDNILFIDVRIDERWEKGRIASALHLDHRGITKEKVKKFASADTPMVLYCDGVECGVSAKVAKQLVDWGYTKVHYFRGGYPVWRNAGYPTEK